jgi:hypothetical protein
VRYFNFDENANFGPEFRVAVLVKSTGKFTKSEHLRPAAVTTGFTGQTNSLEYAVAIIIFRKYTLTSQDRGFLSPI